MNRYLDVVFNLPTPGPFTYLLPQGGARREEGEAPTGGLGFRVKAPFGRRSLVGYVVGEGAEPLHAGYQVKEIERVVDAEPLFDGPYLELARWVAGMYYSSLGEALATMLPGGKRESRIAVLSEDGELPEGGHELSKEQSAALEGILEGDGAGSPLRSSYLFGVTGSGKTEVFLQAAERTIAAGAGVIYLVPEISLTHQLVDVVRARFGGRVALLHSGLTPSQKLVEWLRIRRGEAMLVIGARSAVFAPVPRLGLLVIDEEHEGSYKSGATPRYHARQVAMRRAAVSGARLVMGSATPSVEAVHLMGDGRIKRHLLTRRLAGGAMPQITVVDMKEEEGSISRLLSAEIRRTHDEGRQTILFLNRRGFSYFFHCRSCGYEMRCARCSVSLTFHKDRNRMVCHYCGYSRRPIEVCPECASLDVGYSGFGTELIEEEIERRFPDLTVARVDTDSIRQKGSLRTILGAFREGRYDVLLGTQMVAKGLNFPGVKLVGIVLADTGLHLPDFRAQERTFSLIVQVSGRAGRFIPDGKVIVQTYRPDNEAVMLAAANRVDEFYERELATRRALRFPPFTRLIRLVLRGKEREKVLAAATELSRRIARHLAEAPAGGVRDARPGAGAAGPGASGPSGSGPGHPSGPAAGEAVAEILGPAECPIGVIAGSCRYQLIVRTTQFARAHAALARAIAGVRLPRDLYLEVDVDPVSLL